MTVVTGPIESLTRRIANLARAARQCPTASEEERENLLRLSSWIIGKAYEADAEIPYAISSCLEIVEEMVPLSVRLYRADPMQDATYPGARERLTELREQYITDAEAALSELRAIAHAQHYH